MLIGEVIEQCGVTRDTIRHYEARGLIDAPERRDNNYKEYPLDTVNRVKFIRDMQGVGFTLRQTREFLALYDDRAATCGNTASRIQAHMADLDEKIEQLMGMRERMQTMFQACTGNADGDPCSPITNILNGN
jgi:MerR family transcriptional regulator, copper efflux regulator